MVSLYILVLLLLIVFGSKITIWNDSYIDKQHTTTLNGMFIILVFLSHANGYIHLTDYTDFGTRIYNFLFTAVGQMMVVMFFFYSGYGLMTQFHARKHEYVLSFFKSRILKTWLHFIVALIPFGIINLLLGYRFGLNTWLLSLTGFESIGNSNWYIFDVLCLYLLFYFVIYISDKRIVLQLNCCIAITALTIVLWFVIRTLKGSQRWWYDTILAFPAGCFYAFEKANIERKVRSSRITYFVVMSVVFCLFCSFYIRRNPYTVSLSSVFFGLFVVGTTYIFDIRSTILNWLGNRLFFIYIFQRLPMIALSYFGIDNKPMVFIFLSFILTIAITLVMEKVYFYLDKTLRL